MRRTGDRSGGHRAASTPAPAARGVIFDMDGVLIDNSPAYAQAWYRLLAENPGVRYPDYPAEKTFGRRNDDLFPEVWGKPLSRAELDRLGERIEAIYRELFAPHMAPVAGLPELIAGLRASGMRLALATSAPQKNVDWVLRELDLEAAFSVVLSERDVTRGKPDPEIYRKAIERLGLKPRECVVFEDAIVGIAAALAAGARCIALATSFAPAELLAAGAERVIRDFREITPEELVGAGEATAR